MPSGLLQDITSNVDNYLTNKFQVAVRLFSNRSQMTSKCGKNKNLAHVTEQTHGNLESICFI